MQLFFGITYLLFFAGVIIASLFIMFHLSRYAINQRLATGMTVLFVVVTSILLFTNSMLFLSLPIESLVLPIQL